jgi:hypothetical protein
MQVNTWIMTTGAPDFVVVLWIGSRVAMIPHCSEVRVHSFLLKEYSLDEHPMIMACPICIMNLC